MVTNCYKDSKEGEFNQKFAESGEIKAISWWTKVRRWAKALGE